MTLKLYTLKCKGGYIRISTDGGCTCVGLDKASVFDRPDHRELKKAQRRAKDSGIGDLRVVELQIIENDYHLST